MADFQGANKIGFLLGGGARQMKSQAFDEGRLNTAKTEQALADARKTQLEATAKANAQRAAEKFKTDYINTESGKGRAPQEVAAEAEMIGNILIAGTGADFHASMQGMGERQETDLMRTMADPATSAEKRLRAGGALQRKPYSDILPVGSHGVVDATLEDQKLIVPPGGGNQSTAVKNYLFNRSLPPDQQDDFSTFVRADQMVNAGGVIYASPGVNPDRRPATPVVDPATAADNAAALAEAKKTGTTRAAQKADFPMVRYSLQQNTLSMSEQNKLIDELLADEKLWQAVGPTQLIAKIPGVEGAYIRGKLDTLGNKIMLSTLINLRAMSKTGGAVGNVSDREGDTMRGSQGVVTNFNLMAGDMRKELMRVRSYNDEFEKIMNDAFTATYDDQGNPRLGAPAADPAAGGGGGFNPGDRYTDEDDGQEYEYGGEPGGDGKNPDDWYPVAQ